MTAAKLFYLQDSRSLCGSNVVFWRTDGNGYGTNLDELEVYSLEDVQCMHNRRNSDVPLLKSLVDEKSIMAVDCQVLPNAETKDINDQYVVQVKDCWNGNDILFICKYGNTYEYGGAEVFNRKDAEKHFPNSKSHAIFSKAAIDQIARKTFQAENIDKKEMITKAGIKLAKPKRIRPTTGKSRGNCPECGKITWGYNLCKNTPCAEHN